MQKNKGLADTQSGEFVLNESGTSISTDAVEEGNEQKTFSEELNEKEEDTSGKDTTSGSKQDDQGNGAG